MKLFLPILALVALIQLNSCSSETVESSTHPAIKFSAPSAVQSAPMKMKREVYAEASDAVGEDYEEYYEEDEDVLQSKSQEIKKSVNQKIIKNGRVVFETESLKETRSKVLEQAKTFKAYIANDEEYKSLGRITNSIVLRVPSQQFENLLQSSTEGVKHFDNKEISAEDVTEEYVDLQARITSKKVLEKRYFELLKKAKNVKEMLEIESQLGKLRTDVESMEGRLRYLKNRVSYSTLNITFYEEIPENKKVNKKYANGFRDGWDNLMDLVVSIISFWPFIIFGLILLLIGKRIYRRRKAKRLTE